MSNFTDLYWQIATVNLIKSDFWIIFQLNWKFPLKLQ